MVFAIAQALFAGKVNLYLQFSDVLTILLAVVLVKKVVWRTFKNVAQRFKVFKLYCPGLPINKTVEILIA